MKSHAKSIALHAMSLRRTRRVVFFWACLISAGCGSGGTWYYMQQIPPPPVPELEILRQAGIRLYVSEHNGGTGLQITGRKAETARATTPQENSQPGYILVWRNQ
jgi:hypothetical protein